MGTITFRLRIKRLRQCSHEDRLTQSGVECKAPELAQDVLEGYWTPSGALRLNGDGNAIEG